ncbi:MAG: hypothetical protein DWI55_01030 [Chloroflexi bacterium]|nr:MAG: hypothetical protein DWI55_01030 [Chloroflexota bacterium]
MFSVHSKLATTSVAVTVCLCLICVVAWWRGRPLGGSVPVLHGILGLLMLSAAVLGIVGMSGKTLAPLHGIYTAVWFVVWLFLWQGVNRFVLKHEQARFWTVASVLLLVLLHRITTTG